MKRYTVKTRFIFEGCFFIRAESKAQAKEYVEQQCGMVMGGSIHTLLPDEDADWDFPIHPDKEVVQIKANKAERCYE